MEITLKTFPDPSRNSEEKEKAKMEKKAKRMAIAKLSASKAFCITSKRNETKWIEVGGDLRIQHLKIKS